MATYLHVELFFSLLSCYLTAAMNTLADIQVKDSSQRVLCTFLNDPINTEQACTIWYGPQGEDCMSTSQTSKSESNAVTVGLPLDLNENLKYCFSVKAASTGVHSVIVEGTFVSGKLAKEHQYHILYAKLKLPFCYVSL